MPRKISDEKQKLIESFLGLGCCDSEIARFVKVNTLTVTNYREKLEKGGASFQRLTDSNQIVRKALARLHGKATSHFDIVFQDLLRKTVVQSFFNRIKLEVASWMYLFEASTPIDRLWWFLYDETNLCAMIGYVRRWINEEKISDPTRIHQEVKRRIRNGEGIPYWPSRDDEYLLFEVAKLPDREYYVIDSLFGLTDSKGKTLQEVGDALGIGRERVRQIELSARRKLIRALRRCGGTFAHFAALREDLHAKNQALVIENGALACELQKLRGEGHDPNAVSILTEEMDFGPRTYNCLRKVRIETLGQLCEYTEQELLGIRNFGRKSLNEVIAVLARYGLNLCPPAPPDDEEVFDDFLIPEEEDDNDLFVS